MEYRVKCSLQGLSFSFSQNLLYYSIVLYLPVRVHDEGDSRNAWFGINSISTLLLQGRGTTAVVQDPCPSNINGSTIVADICKSNSATNEMPMVDSGVLHIMIHKDNCVCQYQPVSLVLRMSVESSAKKEGECGFAVDINHIPTGNVIAPIECISNVEHRTKQLFLNSSLQFETIIINGTYTDGYCTRTYLDINSNRSQVVLIDYDELMTNICDPTTTEPTPDEIPIHNRTTTIMQTTDSLQSTAMRPKEDTKSNYQGPEEGNTAYIVGACCSIIVIMVLLVVLAITCIRKKSSIHFNMGNIQIYYINRKHCCIHSTDSIDMSCDAIDDDRSQSSNNVAWRI